MKQWEEERFAERALVVLKAVDEELINLEHVRNDSEWMATFKTSKGQWWIRVFFDCGEFDYIDSIWNESGSFSFDAQLKFDEIQKYRELARWMPTDGGYELEQAFKENAWQRQDI